MVKCNIFVTFNFYNALLIVIDIFFHGLDIGDAWKFPEAGASSVYLVHLLWLRRSSRVRARFWKDALDFVAVGVARKVRKMQISTSLWVREYGSSRWG